MPKTIFTPAEIKAYWDTSRDTPIYLDDSKYNMDEIEMLLPNKYNNLHPFYMRAVKIAEAMRVHADGFYPYQLINERRPNEPEEVKAYRCKIWMAKTKPTFGKILASLGKIRRSADWLISWPNNMDEFTLIRTGEDLQTYVEGKMPFFGNITSWIFDVALRKYLIDPNAVVYVKPLDTNIPDNEYLKPYPAIYDSINVLDFVENDYAILFDPYGAKYFHEGKQQVGRRMTIVTTISTFTFDQANNQGDYTTIEFKHNLGYLPVFKMGGTIIEQSDDAFLYESRIAGIIPELNEAVRENSDLQAVKVTYQFPERYEWTNTDCKVCNGLGRVPNPDWTDTCECPDSFECSNCHGAGITAASSPFSKTVLKIPDAASSSTMPSIPIGYVQKDTDIVKIQELSVKGHIYDALSAINFEFLGNVPGDQSGVAKQYDRNESNNTSHAVAEDLVTLMDKVVKATALYRFTFQYAPDLVIKLLPHIPVPENYDLYSVADAQKSITDAKNGKVNPIIVNAMEKDYASKVFSSDPTVRSTVDLILTLDPLPNISEDEKMARLSNKGITQLSYVISSNIQEFIQNAMETDKGFADKPLPEQKAVLAAMGQAIINANSSTGKLIPIDGGKAGLDTASAGGANGLKGSVGGLTGMIEIAKAVASGVYPLEAAVALVADRFGITPEEARRQLGTPKAGELGKAALI